VKTACTLVLAVCVAPLIGAAQSAATLAAPADIESAQQSQYDEIEGYLDRQVIEAGRIRRSAWQRDFTSLEAYEKSIDPWRNRLWELLGGRPYAPAELDPREELVARFDTHAAYRVRFTAFENVRTCGILLVPRGAGPFPALICVHGMAGTPEGVCGLAEPDYHNRFGLTAAERGYVVFAPLDMNTQKKRIWLDRKAMLVGQRLQGLEQYKVMRVVDYLAGRPDVDARRIGAYGISWGGRTVMNLGALDRRVAAVAIAGHFNDLVPKMIEPSPNSSAYIQTPEEYAFFPGHFRLFNDADVVSLICPRPVFIEQGRQDHTAWWERSQAAFEEVKAVYDRLGIGERAVYSMFEGPHEIHGVESFRFFDRWLKPR
jgi:fermentation-respiration switch protein FrsA (DUF1100 family)